ncbi:fibronectin type III domain-containing protein [Paenibacillus oleatilyticus]|uniref:fibronectin type III domain-containing protein n=1 Tax=Paenibacillus oleatilyticus TaxID=2594886 RepID=UPI001C1F45A9|nr:glycosyl hydrolase family 18 protein [Paenibacillus oleatilyticus]MBU7319362.1 fibronectin type III domain-containing protein [Paenibacillus oleatilyticus]
MSFAQIALRRTFRKAFSLTVVALLLLSLIPAMALGASEWQPNTAYKAGEVVTYAGQTYTCLQPHTSLTGWEPPNVPALWKAGGSGGTDTQPPTAPSGLKATGKTSNSVTLAWNASTDNVGVTGYDVYNGSAVAASVTGTTATIGGLSANTAYTFTVKAKDAAGNVSAASQAVTVTTDPASGDTQPPTAPTNLAVTGKTSSSISLSWTASTDNVGVTGYTVEYGSGSLSVAGTTATVAGLAADTTYTFIVKAKDAAGNVSAGASVQGKTEPAPSGGGGKIVVGYWHNFDNGSSVLKLRDVSKKYDVINVAFAEPVSPGSGTIAFTPFNATVDEFKADVAYLKSQGKKVLISLGGANGTVTLSDATKKQQFISTMTSIIQTYGFDGIDIDLEGSSVALNGGDTDFKNPTTPGIVNLIDAVRTLSSTFGSGFVLTMAPETAYVQGGMGAYGGPWGAYLPIIHALRDKLNYIHVQHYNSGSMMGLDGRSYAQGTADFHVAMAEMLLKGFPVNNNANNVFPALRPEQVAIGVPAVPSAAGGGYTPAAEVQKAITYLVKGTSFGGSYKLQNPAGYPGFKGLMTWSINWDAASGYGFVNSHRPFLDGLK